MIYRIIVIGAILVFGGFFLSGEFTDYFNKMGGHDMMHGSGVSGSLTKLPEGELDYVKPTEIVDLKDGDTFDLEASIVKQETGNRTIKRLAYNGQIPGPVLRVEKDATVTVNFTNNIDMETTVHSHGLRQDWKQDGTPGISQEPIKIGETFTYELHFPDTGVYWYHPHVREDYQQEMGLYGNFIVEEESYWNDVDQEEYLIVDDYLEDGDFDGEITTHTLMGRYGNSMLINDQKDYELTVQAGAITRLFVTNVANTRTFDLHFQGTTMKLVGGDVGRIEKETIVEEIHPAPSERYVVELFYRDAGTYPILHRGEQIGTVNVTTSDIYRAKEFESLRENSNDYTDIRNNMNSLLSRQPDKDVRLDIEMKGMMGGMMDDEMMMGRGSSETYSVMGMQLSREQAIEHCQVMPQMSECRQFDNVTETDTHSDTDGIEWEDQMPQMNAMSTDESIRWIFEDTKTGKQNMDVNWEFTEGDMVKVRIFNDPNTMHPMQHPIHFHGQRFVVLSRDDVANENLQWKDTVLIPMGQTVDLLVDMSNPGNWMGHCHIAEHLNADMMFNFSVTKK